MFKQAKRHQEILELLSQNGFASTEELVAQLDVSPQTIRRDLNELAEQGKVARHHGGASLPSAPLVIPAKSGSDAESRLRMARFIAQRIPDGASLFLSSGPLMEAVAAALLDHRDLRIATSNLNIAALLTARDDFQVYISAGQVCSRTGLVQSQSAYDFLRQFQMDYCLLEACAVEPDGQLLGLDEALVSCEQIMIRQARAVWVAIPPHAAQSRGMFFIAAAMQISEVFFAELPETALTQVYDQQGVKWKICS
ncbi:DeoR family transcriptional regulator [Pseudaeromonas sharmana]|uniref:DeoR family transcriptional regulator n=1 Tax=Pseudaeromonas sharmana TaxID=328412 RepID=A0ABV8CP61_9GAMM